MEARRAQDYLRDIHAIMERSVRHSTLSGLSGIIAGMAAIGGAVLSTFMCADMNTPSLWVDEHTGKTFLIIWLGVLVVAAASDMILTKRKARKIGKQFFDRPMRRVLLALVPGFACGLAVTIYFALGGLYAVRSVEVHYNTDIPMIGNVFRLPMYWMIFYGLALVSVSSISLRELFIMGIAFVAAGIYTMFWGLDNPMLMMGISFGGFHLVYGIYMWLRYGG